MKIYSYFEQEHPSPISITEEEILDIYWDCWRMLMENKFGADHYLITPESCIEDWVFLNCAWRKN